MRVLVTGGAGFIGSHLVDQLVNTGHSVWVLDNLDPQVHPDEDWPDYLSVSPWCARLRGDVREPADVRVALDTAQPDVLVHLAAKVGVGQSMYDIAEYTSVNVQGTAVLLEEIERRREVDRPKRIVVASSMSIYGEGGYYETGAPEGYAVVGTQAWHPAPTREDKPLRPASIYAITKRDQEEMCLVFGQAYGIPTTALRFFNTYGPRQKLGNPYTGVVAIFASRLLSGKSPVIFGDGQQTRDFVYVEDVARAILYAAEPLRDLDPSGLAINVGTGQATSVNALADLLQQELVLRLEPKHVRERAGDVRHCFADVQLAKRTMGWSARYGLPEGFRLTMPWLLEQAEIVDGVDDAVDLLHAHRLLG